MNECVIREYHVQNNMLLKCSLIIAIEPEAFKRLVITNESARRKKISINMLHPTWDPQRAVRSDQTKNFILAHFRPRARIKSKAKSNRKVSSPEGFRFV